MFLGGLRRPGQGPNGSGQGLNRRPNQRLRRPFRPVGQRRSISGISPRQRAGAQRSFRFKRQSQFGDYGNDEDYYDHYDGDSYGVGQGTRSDFQDDYEDFFRPAPEIPIAHEEPGKNPVLQMNLSKDNRLQIQKRLQRHQCQAMSSLGSGEPCQSSIECRCGEYCSRKGICEPATCDLASAGICQQYPGFNAK